MAWAHGCAWSRNVKVSANSSFFHFALILFLNKKYFIRSLGDTVAHTAGVTSEPEFTERELDPNTDNFIVVATDGLWEFVDNNETAEMVASSGSPTESVEVLVKEANSRWMQEEQVIDDTTIITAHLFGYKS